MRKNSKTMAGRREEEICSVKGLLCSLCEKFVAQEERAAEYKWKSNPLKLPNHLRSGAFKNNDSVKKHLFKTCYDLLLLRRNEWYGRWSSPLTPECRCLVYGYHLQQAGENHKASRLLSLLDSGTLANYDISDSLLTLLSILSTKLENKPRDSYEPQVLSPNAYTYYSDSLFNETPGTSLSSLHYKNDKFLTRPPGTGLMGFCSQNDIMDNLHPSSSSLFCGLTHTTTPTVNTVLHLPLLTNEQPDLLDRYLKKFSATRGISKKLVEEKDVQDDSLIELIDRVDSIDEAPPTSWEGLLEYVGRPYLSESGPKGFLYSTREYMALLKEMSGVKSTVPLVDKRSLDCVTILMTTLRSCEDKENGLNRAQFLDEVVQSFYSGVRCMMHTCRVRLDQLLAMKGCTELTLQFNANQIMHLIQYVDHLLKQCDRSTTGLTVLDNLYELCMRSEGLPPYQLILGLFQHSIVPYLRILELWVYLGQYLQYSHSLGVMVDQTALDRRDHLYWVRGFSLSPDKVPVCLSKHAKDILNVGRSLNLLNLITPKHHLCSSVYQAPQLEFAQTLQELKGTQEAHSEYQLLMETLGECLKEQRKAERQEKKMLEMEPVLRARRAAQRFMDDIKQKEVDDELAVLKKKQSLMIQQKKDFEMARAHRLEEAAQERERDRNIVNRLSERERERVQAEEELKEKARSELIDYYCGLTKEAELRTLRAQWRAKRFALARERLEYLEREQLIEEQEHISGGPPQLSPTGSQDNDSSSENLSLEEIISIDEQPVVLEASSHCNDATTPTTHIDKEDSSLLVPAEDITVVVLSDLNTATPPLPVTDEVVTSLVPKPHPSQSTIQDLLYKDTVCAEHISTRGTAPLSTVQELLYPGVEEDPLEQEPLTGGVQEKPTQEDPPQGEEEQVLDEKEVEEEEEALTTDTERELEEEKLDENGLHSSQALLLQNQGKGSEAAEERPIANKSFSVNEESDEIESLENIQYPRPCCYSRYNTDIELCSAPPFSHATITTLPPSDPSLFLWPIDSLIDHCIVRPITLQSRLVNSALVDCFINELNIKGHFVNLKQFLFLEGGEFASVLSSGLFEKLMYGCSVHEMCSASFLHPLLVSALEEAHSSNLVSNLRLKVHNRPRTVSMTAVKALGFMKLEYSVEWPLNIVIHHDHLDSYNKVFHLMLEIKRCSWALKNVFLKLTKGHHGASTIPSSEMRLIHAQRQELQHFVSVMESYISNQIFHLTWNEFESKLSSLTSLDELIEAHEQYLEMVLFRCLLVKKTQGILTLIEECLSCVIRFSCCFLLGDQLQSISMSSIHKKFREISSLLFKVVTKLVERGYQPHLEDLLLRMNFNKFYKH